MILFQPYCINKKCSKSKKIQYCCYKQQMKTRMT